MKTLSRKYGDSKVQEALEMYKDKSYKVKDIEDLVEFAPFLSKEV